MTSISLDWDGDTVLQKTKVDDVKITPKEFINSLEHARAQISQMEEQKVKLKSSIDGLRRDLVSANKWLSERVKFEEKALELQKNKLQDCLAAIYTECKEKAEKEAAEVIAKDPNTYMVDKLVKNLHYVIYQRNLATHPKVAEKISSHIIKQYLFDTPVFENPFK